MPELGPAVEYEARSRLGPAEADAFLTRLEALSFDITGPLGLLYSGVADVHKLATQLVLDALHAAAARPADLRRLDRRREIDPAWFQRSRIIGYVCYADRFGGSLSGVREHLDYLVELGVTYLHLMPLLRPRDGESDGGYAVADYDQVDPRIGTMADLQALAGDLHERGIALCVDLVLNHTAREHEWARKALAGEPDSFAHRRFLADFYAGPLAPTRPGQSPAPPQSARALGRPAWLPAPAWLHARPGPG